MSTERLSRSTVVEMETSRISRGVPRISLLFEMDGATIVPITPSENLLRYIE